MNFAYKDAGYMVITESQKILPMDILSLDGGAFWLSLGESMISLLEIVYCLALCHKMSDTSREKSCSSTITGLYSKFSCSKYTDAGVIVLAVNVNSIVAPNG